MAIDPNPSIWNSDDSQEVSAINYGLGDAGTYLLLEAGTEYHVWNDKGMVKGSSTMICVRVSARDDNGDEIKNITKQHWVEIKSYGVGPFDNTILTTDVDITTEIITVIVDFYTGQEIKFTTTDTLPSPLIVGTLYYAIRVDATHIKVATTLANANAGTAIDLINVGVGTHTVIAYMVDDNMTEFQPVGLNAPLNIGDIPANCYRKIMVRVKLPNSAIEGAVTFQIYVLNQEPSTSIAKWITDLHGNGVIYRSAGAFAVSIGTPASKLDIEKGFALIDSLEAYYGAAQQYDVSGLGDGTYKLYLTSVGVISAIISTSSIPANSIELYRVIVSGAVATAITDKRNFIMQRIISQHFQDLLAANTSGIHAAITGTGAIQNITTGIINPDYARNASITTTNVATPSGNVKIVGLVRGKNDEEEIAIVAGSIAYSNKAFDIVTKIVIPAGVSASDTVTVGFSDKIGLDNSIVVTSDVFKKKVNNEDKTSELSGNVSAVYHTVDCATIVANEDMELRYKCLLTI